MPSSSPHSVSPFPSCQLLTVTWDLAPHFYRGVSPYLLRGSYLSSCALYSACISCSVGSGVKQWSISFFSTFYFSKGAGKKAKGEAYLAAGGTVTGLTKEPVVTQQEGLQTPSRRAGPRLTCTKAYRSCLSYLMDKRVMVCILTHSLRHCHRQSGQQHLGPRTKTKRGSVTFHFRWRMICGMKMVQSLWKKVWWFNTKPNVLLSYFPANAFFDIYLKDLKN